MDKAYQPDLIEQRLYDSWERANYFAPNQRTDSNTYCIMLPPPNVTGSLHMGHAFQQTLMDILIRYHRMHSYTTLWQCGTDHAGIATQMVVERQLQQDNINRHDLGRKKFTEAVWAWKQQSGDSISQQSRRLGTSMDWSREQFTMNDNLSHAVTEAFVRLYNDGLIYRGKRLVNWDPVLKTAVSDLEVIAKEETGKLYYLRYPLTAPTETLKYLVVATTRPETMLGDAAVAVHPDDSRYQLLIGKTLKLPIANREIPIIADDYVDPEFGTGCVKITPAHDFNDYAVWQRHRQNPLLQAVPYQGLINIFSSDASIVNTTTACDPVVSKQARREPPVTTLIPSEYQGLDRTIARGNIIQALKDLGLFEQDKSHQYMVPRGDRSNAIIEPYLTDQWFIKTERLAAPAIDAVKAGRVKFVPENWDKTYYEWMHNIEDWCISRQLWWGHQIPAWYDEQGHYYVGYSEQSVRANNNLADSAVLRRDEDVLDTWFSSALWPFATLGWGWSGQTTKHTLPALKQFYPTNVLVTGFDIIFFWVARMIMFGLYFINDVPFKTVYIHGLVRDGDGQKMAKSKGNVLDPIDLIDGISLPALIKKRTSGMMQPQLATKIEQATRQHFPNGIAAYGTDALRFTFAALATQGRFINFETGRIKAYRNFCNKLWNASRYIMQQVALFAQPLNPSSMTLAAMDKWIISKLAATIVAVDNGIQSYRFDLAAQTLYDFTWHEYCDWYIELSKPILSDTEEVAENRKCAVLYTLLTTLEQLLRTLHPFMPFITECLWQKITPSIPDLVKSDSIMLAAFPKADALKIDKDAVKEVEWLKALITTIRQIRTEKALPNREVLRIACQGGSLAEQSWFKKYNSFIQKKYNIDELDQQLDNITEATVSYQVGSMTISVLIATNKQADINRLIKKIASLKKNQQRLKQRLDDPKFCQHAPKEIVADTSAQYETTKKEIARYQTELSTMEQPPC